GKNSWLTGTAAWTFTVLTQGILGIQPDYDGLTVDPCIPHEVKQYTVNRLFRNTMYHITVSNPNGVEKGVKAIRFNGQDIPVGPLPLTDAPAAEVEIIMG
ncbi:MAG: hypothetical protein IJI05_03915, partial [Erysipelotrichaceae bacterium]|nr:hypothetical protein [Erysipelotrichaceae bacterium]